MTEQSRKPRIVTLSQSVIDRIAAGEVVERPAAVVKELIENSLDSGAGRIKVVIQDSGRTLIQVVDDGSGMSGSELATAVGRHSTSKLSRFEDLESLQTFGFRGEALPSIAAVSRLTVVSRTEGEEVGTELMIAGGKVERCEPKNAPLGTSVSVAHLFYNVPARRKFLRQDSTEFRWITSVFKHFTLAFPDVAWELYRNDDLLYQLSPSDWRGRMAGMFGDDIAEDLVEINHEGSWLKVHGWITPGSLSQRTTSDQYLFVNKRPITSPRLNRAIYTACEPYYISGGHPIYAIMLDASPDLFDINVHPAKKEVKFADEKGAFTTLWSAVRNALSADRMPREMVESRKKETSDRQHRITNNNLSIKAPAYLKPVLPRERPGRMDRVSPVPFPQVKADDKKLSESEQSERHEETSTGIRIGVSDYGSENGPTIWQIFDTFLVSPLKTGLVFIDQHVAHERILYERSLRAIEREPWTSQQLLFPVNFSLMPEDTTILEECLPMLRAMGFELEKTGMREYRIIAVPAAINISNERDLLFGIISEYKDTANTGLDPRHRLAAAFACRGAIKAGQPLEEAQMQHLIDELFQTDDPEFCPHGRPIYHVLNRRDIEKWFRR